MVSEQLAKAAKGANWSLKPAARAELAASLAARQPSW
jgi:hypothetical protein